MSKVTLVKHAPGAPGLRYLGLGPRLYPINGIKQLQGLLNNNTLWAKSRSIQDIRKMLSHSTVTVSLWKGAEIIGFGRATSDEIFRAVLWDIVVADNLQGKGLGSKVVEALLSTKSIKKVERIYLMTTNGTEFYKQLGFKNFKNQDLLVKFR